MDGFDDEVSEKRVPIARDAASINSKDGTSSNAMGKTGINNDLSGLGPTA